MSLPSFYLQEPVRFADHVGDKLLLFPLCSCVESQCYRCSNTTAWSACPQRVLADTRLVTAPTPSATTQAKSSSEEESDEAAAANRRAPSRRSAEGEQAVTQAVRSLLFFTVPSHRPRARQAKRRRRGATSGTARSKKRISATAAGQDSDVTEGRPSSRAPPAASPPPAVSPVPNSGLEMLFAVKALLCSFCTQRCPLLPHQRPSV